MNENQPKFNNNGLSREGGVNWKPGVEIFTQISGWIVAPIVLALVLGKSLDARFGTRPVIFLILAGIGFLFSCFGIVRVVKKYLQKIKDLAEKE